MADKLTGFTAREGVVSQAAGAGASSAGAQEKTTLFRTGKRRHPAMHR